MRPRALVIFEDVREAVRALHPEARRKVWAAVTALRVDPFQGRALREKLVGLWRFPVGRLRIVYRFDDTKLEVVAVAPRATVYEDLVRRLGERRARYRRLGRASRQQEEAVERQLMSPRSAGERAEGREWAAIRSSAAKRLLGGRRRSTTGRGGARSPKARQTLGEVVPKP